MDLIQRKKRWILFGKIFAALCLFIALHQFCDKRTEGFWLQKLFTEDLPSRSEWNTSSLAPEEQTRLHAALDQPYYFLGMGSECFTFLSQDKKTVIKFFKLDQMRFVYFKRAWSKEDHSSLADSSHWLAQLPLPGFLDAYRKRVAGIRMYRIQSTFNSCKIAWDHLRKETGLVYLHLNPTSDLHKQLVVYDKIGIRHVIDLDSTRFVLQETAELVGKKIRTLQNAGNEQGSQKSIDSLLTLIVERCKKGIADRDPIIKQNFGFIEGRAIEIDTGSFSLNQQMKHPFNYRRELYFETRELQEWLEVHYPSLALYLDAQINRFLTASVTDPT